ncbi:putative G-protein coupled receptor 139 [Mustelus asterias]
MFDQNVTVPGPNRQSFDGEEGATGGRRFSFWLDLASADGSWITTEWRVFYAFKFVQTFYYPILAIIGVPVNLLTIVILAKGKCGLSKCITGYLVAMAAADLLVIVLDVIWRQIPVTHVVAFNFLLSAPTCNVHAVLLYAATDCSVWYTITFTIDRYVAICCPWLKLKYSNQKTAGVVLATVTALSFLKDATWYFMFTGRYRLMNEPWFCYVAEGVQYSRAWGTIEFLQNVLTPGIPFVLILLLNALTVRHILVSSRARRRLRAHSGGESPRDPELESRKKCIVLMFVISANFILLWSVFMVFSIWNRMWYLGYESVYMGVFVLELGFMLQLLSCCTNTAIYAVTQTMFREQLKEQLKYPFTKMTKFIHWCRGLTH